VDTIIKQCLTEVENLLRSEMQLFERFARELLTREELDYDEIEEIFTEFNKTNPRRFLYDGVDGDTGGTAGSGVGAGPETTPKKDA
jgi:hypothetical protein